MHSSIVKNIAFPLHEKLLKRPTISYADELEKSQWLTRDEIELIQRKKLKQLLNLATTHCPWHEQRIIEANLDLSAHNLLTLEDLTKIPTMSKQDAQIHGDTMTWLGAPGGAYKYTTGGSSGTPLNFHFGKWRQASDAAGRIRARRGWGIDIGDKEVYLWGAPVELAKTDTVKQVRDRLMNQVLLNAFDMSPTTMTQYLQTIQQYQPKCMYGYASSLALLAKFAQSTEQKINIPSLKVIFTTGEPLYPDQRKIIQKIFQVPVANEFGSRDIGFTAHESPAGQMLLMSESHILEILNNEGQPVKNGETGEAVITGLCSQAQPFIRYRTGDMITATNETCKEGRGLHVLGEVLGRSTDFIIKQDGTILHALAVIYVLRAIKGVESFKIIQHSKKELEVQIVPNSLWQKEARQKIIEQLQQRMGNINIEINCLDSIPPEKSGKHRYVVSHVPLPTSF
ncbi:phenylacetate--CoA ligase family protein [methanotrophic endosymbiont of Bathymodiolus puteoserpentis (Logatchev)]|jgi:phenylacetate-CoA ligase|uniref:phenylacetate--CoA ligase family protein n=1 Tax=methanotrophic endosymbiont of Bathymodiolus puteoserpentis (Logatchev) TaxID=343235 RepID=UPI0013C5C7C4|nr:phenylacetate--CoA ligase family protein [methanotrophic endosymbiont of Bathymodiolus puteoserpentis (Logatchev)]SHE23218.1 CoA ligase [methanotrophic endosymbiont of Bathymodiolus puteoserpentis (Logatchev)]